MVGFYSSLDSSLLLISFSFFLFPFLFFFCRDALSSLNPGYSTAYTRDNPLPCPSLSMLKSTVPVQYRGSLAKRPAGNSCHNSSFVPLSIVMFVKNGP